MSAFTSLYPSVHILLQLHGGLDLQRQRFERSTVQVQRVVLAGLFIHRYLAVDDEVGVGAGIQPLNQDLQGSFRAKQGFSGGE